MSTGPDRILPSSLPLVAQELQHDIIMELGENPTFAIALIHAIGPLKIGNRMTRKDGVELKEDGIRFRRTTDGVTTDFQASFIANTHPIETARGSLVLQVTDRKAIPSTMERGEILVGRVGEKPTGGTIIYSYDDGKGNNPSHERNTHGAARKIKAMAGKL